ncbi:uncharacterized protein [Bemisia tabaci]|uniref:uncharacterized protein n=1 Tax=Bemisia tabaci TaxID=7038 RepID=UPI0008F9D104|nr:PREDICTED: uncharacterized protein LOC109032946 [Bemisia tabaci]
MADESRNIEIKAKVHDFEYFIRKSEEISGGKGTFIEQEDIFFNVPNGRLKLRFRDKNTDCGELIYYERPDQQGPKLSKFNRSNFGNSKDLQHILALALGIKGVVRKKRLLYLTGQTRIHADLVENLGSFMELEVCLQKNQTPEEGMRIAESLMNLLGVSRSDLQPKAYIDLLEEKFNSAIAC